MIRQALQNPRLTAARVRRDWDRIKRIRQMFPNMTAPDAMRRALCLTEHLLTYVRDEHQIRLTTEDGRTLSVLNA